jgi:hypothetical protein
MGFFNQRAKLFFDFFFSNPLAVIFKNFPARSSSFRSSIRMAIVARRAVVLIVGNFAEMLVIHFLLVVLMARDAFKNFVIVRINVAGGTILPLVAMSAGIDREKLCIVIEGRRLPGIYRMAGRTIMGEIQSYMIRIGWPLKIVLMAQIAIFRRSGKDVVHVTACASHRLMRTKQWKSRVVVIERRRFPSRGGVTGQAIVRKISRHMVGVGHARKITLMA